MSKKAIKDILVVKDNLLFGLQENHDIINDDPYKTCYNLLQGIVLQQGGTVEVHKRHCNFSNPKPDLRIDYDPKKHVYVVSISDEELITTVPCPKCNNNTLKQKCADYNYLTLPSNKLIVIPGMQWCECTTCGEHIWSLKLTKAIEKITQD